ncbi:MAG: hypothetical protein JWQ04_2869 [Pedosphaera sp.]|nr:hypothetical protein [Pedosphaera sp.]
MNCLSSAALHPSLRRWLSFILLGVTLCAGCRREQITVYRISKEIPESKVSSLPLTFKIPAGWQEQPSAGMSLANFSIADRKAELSIMTFPGERASQLNLVNVVRGSMGLRDLSDAELAKIVEPVEIGGEKGSLIDLSAGTSNPTNNSADRIMVAVVPHGGATWFFKLAGVSDVVAAQKPALLDFLKSIAFNSVAATPEVSPHGENFASANTGRIPEQPTAPAADAAISDAGKPAWEIPAGWKEVPPTQMLLAKFVISSKDGEADVTVSSFPGNVGGPLPNINRWRGQIGLAPVSAGELDKAFTPLDVTGGKAMLVDVNGKNPRTGKESRLIGIIWPRDGQTWFYKLMGDSAVAGREKDAFLKFIQSVRYPNG